VRYCSKARPYYLIRAQMHRLLGQYWRISKDVRRHDQSFVRMFCLISLISLISLIVAGMALLAGALAWFIIQPSSARGKQAAPQPSLAP
jgi:hypothetical protein